MKQLDLFAGIGGISLAAEWAGIETVAFCEKEPFAKDILRRRFPGRPIYDDVYNLTREVLESDGITRVDIVAGGFPCQPFSHAGKREGTADDRYLWPEMCRIVGELRPTWVFAENVDGLISMAQSGGDPVMEDETTICTEAEMVIETIRKDLKDIGYRSIPVVIPACGVGASHRRYRIFILGYTEHHGSYGAALGRSPHPAGDNYESGANKTGQSAGTGGRANHGSLADATSEGLPQWRRSERAEGDKETGAGLEPGAERRCSMADSEDRQQSQFKAGDNRTEKRRQTQERHGIRASGGSEFRDSPERIGSSGTTSTTISQNVADARCAGCEKCDSATESDEPRYGSRSGNALGAKRAAESGLGGSPYELSDWLDGWGMNPLDALINFISSYPQPALMGQEQHNWEPPRVATGVKNRAARLKALGNAVDPLQALPVLYGIRVIHEFLLRGGHIA